MIKLQLENKKYAWVVPIKRVPIVFDGIRIIKIKRIVRPIPLSVFLNYYWWEYMTVENED